VHIQLLPSPKVSWRTFVNDWLIVIGWCSGSTGRELDLQSTGRGFKAYSGQKLHNYLGQVLHTYLPLLPSLVPAKGR